MGTIQTVARNNLVQQQRELQLRQLQQQQDDQLAGFVSQYMNDRNFLTGTPLDGVLNEKINNLQQKYFAAIRQNPGISKADLGYAMAKDVQEVGLYSKNAKQMKDAIDQRVDAIIKNVKGIDAGKLKASLYSKAFIDPNAATWRSGSDMVQMIEQVDGLVDEVMTSGNGVMLTTESLDDYVKTGENRTVRGTKKTTEANRSGQRKMAEATFNTAFYNIDPNKVRDGSIDIDQDLTFVERTPQDLFNDKRLYYTGVNLARQEFLKSGIANPTQEELINKATEMVNGYIRQRAQPGFKFLEDTKAAPIKVTVNVPGSTSQSDNNFIRVSSNALATGNTNTGILPLTERREVPVVGNTSQFNWFNPGASAPKVKGQRNLISGYGNVVQLHKGNNVWEPVSGIWMSDDGQEIEVEGEKGRSLGRYNVGSQDYMQFESQLFTGNPGLQQYMNTVTPTKKKKALVGPR